MGLRPPSPHAASLRSENAELLAKIWEETVRQESSSAGTRRGRVFNSDPRGATAYRALNARCNDLSQDRPDTAFASKELRREFAVPALKPLVTLKHLIRYVKRGALVRVQLCLA